MATTTPTGRPKSPIQPLSNRVNRLGAFRSPDDPELIQAQQALNEARIEALIRKIGASPPLTDEMRARLSALINGGAA